MSVARKIESPSPARAAADLRTTLEWLKSEGDLIETDQEVDPNLEIIGLQKHLDGSCPMMFNTVKGKPNHRVIANLFGDIKVINKIFGWTDDQDRTIKLAHALTHPIAPVEISRDEAPCQQVVIEKPNDVNEFMVPVRHTDFEPEVTVGSGIRCVTGDYFGGGSDLGYNRMNFRWGNVGTFQISPGSHMWQVVSKHYQDDKPVPITMCFGVPPACTLLAGAGFDYVILPHGVRRDRGCRGGPGKPCAPRQGADGGRHGNRRFGDRDRGLRGRPRPSLRDGRGRGSRRAGENPLPPRVGRLHG